MSNEPSCTWYGRPKYTGWALSGLSPSVKVLWSTQTCSLRRTEIWSYWEFQLPVGAVGGRPGREAVPGVVEGQVADDHVAGPVDHQGQPGEAAPRRPTIVVFGADVDLGLPGLVGHRADPGRLQRPGRRHHAPHRRVVRGQVGRQRVLRVGQVGAVRRLPSSAANPSTVPSTTIDLRGGVAPVGGVVAAQRADQFGPAAHQVHLVRRGGRPPVVPGPSAAQPSPAGRVCRAIRSTARGRPSVVRPGAAAPRCPRSRRETAAGPPRWSWTHGTLRRYGGWLAFRPSARGPGHHCHCACCASSVRTGGTAHGTASSHSSAPCSAAPGATPR